MISIIIPIFNAELYLNECIESILNQTYTNWELLLIDDGSSDKSAEICIKYKNNDQRVKYIYQKNQGVSIARNKGINLSLGDFLFFLDADDYISNHCLETLYNQACKYDYPDIICGQVKTFGTTNINYPFATITKYIKGSHSIQESYYKHEWYEMPWNKLIKRDFVINNKIYFYPDIRHEDTLWSFITALYAKSILLIPENTYFYRIHNNNFITSRNYIKSFQNHY